MATIKETKSHQNQIPSIAWRRRFDERLKKPGVPSRSLSPKMILRMLPMILRLWFLARHQRKTGFDPINLFNTPRPGPNMGVPLGGIGAGSITRGWRGDFLRWALRPGTYHHQVVYGDQFSLFVQREDGPAQAQVLYPSHPDSKQLSAWKWDMDPACGTYHGLFPRAWTTYDQPLAGIRLTCRQVSPVIAHNYRESSYPVAVFHWDVENTDKKPATVGLMFTFINGMGLPNDTAGGHHNSPFHIKKGNTKIIGVQLQHKYCQTRTYPNEVPDKKREIFVDPLTFAIAARQGPGVKVSYQARFNSSQDGSQLWQDFSSDGTLGNLSDPTLSQVDESIGAALTTTVRLKGKEKTEIVFSLAWDMPQVHSGYGSAYHRRYSLFYGNNGDAAPQIAGDAIVEYAHWEKQIEFWQQPVLEDKKLPDWYKMALFNELYYIVDGGTLWAYPVEQKGMAPKKDMGHFAYLEGHEYRMFNTYDVHFYASYALEMNWPELELSLQRDIAQAALADYPEMVSMAFNGQPGRRKVYGMVPHDMGWPDEDYWKRVNGYFLHDVNEWKDLNPKFVLQVYRDYVATEDKKFLKSIWPVVKTVIEKVSRFDTDGDGLIENSGSPDQTYDTWSVSGLSAYTGGIWLACLLAAAAMSEIMGEKPLGQKFIDRYKRGRAAYESKLWNGQYYNYDSSRSPYHDSIMADMLAGQWYAHACGLPALLNADHIRQALKTIFNNNVMRFHNGEMGAINGMRPNGEVDHTNLESQEVWTGTSYALAASMLQEGLERECWQTAKGVVEMTYEKMGYWFQTPEAWDEKGDFRALAYMRPLSIWAIQWAWQRRESQ